jgi:DNA repair protein RecO (recombination protein O)
MQWTDDGLILGVRRLGETSVVLELFTRARGRHLGLVRGGRSRRLQPTLQPGNSVRVTWRARLDEHLGAYSVEPLEARAGRIMERADALHAIAHIAQLLRLLPERDPHEALYETAQVVAEHLDDRSAAPALMVRLEFAVLAELGFGLDLSSCAATGRTEDLIYVSPRSGRAVGREAGAPYADKLFTLPPFLIAHGANASPTPDDVAAGFALTGYFLETRVWGPRGLKVPDARASFLAALARREGAVGSR